MASTVSVLNYQNPAGIVSFRVDGESSWRDLGNVPKLSLKASIETKEHKTSRTGARGVDWIQIVSKDVDVSFTAEEITPENLALFWLGTVAENSDGNPVMTALTSSSITGDLKYVGASDGYGPVYEVIVNSCKLVPADAQEFISEDQTVLTFSGKATDFTAELTSGGTYE